MSRIIVPPIKSQGIKTKLVPWINDIILSSGVDLDSCWIEPFMGTGVVGFNAPIRGAHFVGDSNPHLINFYRSIQQKEITPYTMRKYLEKESMLLSTSDNDGYAHYRLVRDRFNVDHNPYDFLFLSRAGFNGMMRFNSHGDWNVPFCKKKDRFSPAYITKICNQIEQTIRILDRSDWYFNISGFIETIERAEKDDIIYCDPPYFGRYADYYNGWTEQDEKELYAALCRTPAKFILSTWHHNEFRSNEMIAQFWNRFNILTRDHFYHNGGNIENRHSVVEALVFNFELQEKQSIQETKQLDLFAEITF